MRKITLFTAILLLVSICTMAQSHLPHSYTVVHKKMELKSQKPKFESVIVYPQIENPTLASEKGFNELIKSRMKSESETFAGSMKTWKTPKELKGTASYYDIGDSVLYRDSKMISVHFYGDSYFTGSAHPNNWSFSINYDLVNNREIKLSDLFTGDYIRLISEYCINDITRQKKENYDPEISAPDENTLQGAGTKEENFKVFNPTKDGFLITFPTYQVGAYVEGPMDVLMPYSALKDVIKTDGILAEFVN